MYYGEGFGGDANGNSDISKILVVVQSIYEHGLASKIPTIHLPNSFENHPLLVESPFPLWHVPKGTPQLPTCQSNNIGFVLEPSKIP